ncbi:DUF6049 family protein [Microbacterium sp. SLBN-146]|uniref:DUF6049 family protein n=1 Tax=Microbacterium sp. SLBN-146 TaxID=2768457 RepID=UPI00117395BD|nr:DUF6049 family protein [Microbacterium sp. SLBN-146]TQJ30362.1 hypothetical protein FBY39_0810 [Microbacterium sp. SLBN-146]
MTVPPLRTTTRRRLASRLLAILAASALATGLAGGAAAASVTPSPTPTADVSTGTTEFTLAPIRNGILTPGEALTTSVTLENGTALTVARTDVSLELGTSALADRGRLTAWLAGDVAGVDLQPAGSASIDPVAPGETRTASILVPQDAPILTALTPGVYPIVATYTSDDGPVRSTSVIVVPRGDQPFGVGVVVPITADPITEGLLTSEELAVLTGEDGELTTQLDGVELTSAILAVDPAIVAAIRVLGTAAPASARVWLERLESMPNTRFSLQFGDADPAVQVEAGLAQPVGPLSLDSYLRVADFPATPTPTPTATSTPPAASETSPFPPLADLLDTEASRDAVYWPAVASVTPAAVAALGAVSSEDAPLTLVPSTSASTGGARAVAGDAGVLVYDADVSRALTAASSVGESALRAAPLAAASGYLSFASIEAGESPILAAIDRGTDRSYIGLQTAIAAAAEYPGATTHSLSTLSAGTPRDVTIADAAAPEERVADAQALFGDEGAIASFATILDDPTLLTGPERARILQLLAVGWATRPDDARSAVAEHRIDTQETLDSVALLPPTTINLFAAGAGLPFTVRNDLPYAVNLVLYATPDDLRLGVRRANEIVATPQSNTRVEVPVEARVGNGEVTLGLQLRSPSFVGIGPAQSVDINVRAEWETVGIVVLSVLVGGLLLLGILRTVFRARARRRAPNDEDADAPTTPEDPT